LFSRYSEGANKLKVHRDSFTVQYASSLCGLEVTKPSLASVNKRQIFNRSERFTWNLVQTLWTKICRKNVSFVKIGSVIRFAYGSKTVSTRSSQISWPIWEKFGIVGRQCLWATVLYLKSRCSEKAYLRNAVWKVRSHFLHPSSGFG
jgi:hypothetical protein